MTSTVLQGQVTESYLSIYPHLHRLLTQQNVSYTILFPSSAPKLPSWEPLLSRKNNTHVSYVNTLKVRCEVLGMESLGLHWLTYFMRKQTK